MIREVFQFTDGILRWSGKQVAGFRRLMLIKKAPYICEEYIQSSGGVGISVETEAPEALQ